MYQLLFHEQKSKFLKLSTLHHFKDQTLVGFTSEMWKNLPQIIEDYYQQEYSAGSRRQRGQISSALTGGEKY